MFLIGKAVTVNVHYLHMAVITPGLRQIHPAAIRCFLACIDSSGSQQLWSLTAIDVLKGACSMFKHFSISLHGTSVQGALPVILWA